MYSYIDALLLSPIPATTTTNSSSSRSTAGRTNQRVTC
jgi:hypothetical protein